MTRPLPGQRGPERPANREAEETGTILFLVGLTGAGKSTVLPALQADRPLTLLPDRRTLTDRLMLPAALEIEGRQPLLVADRLERFRLTALYRSVHPEGIIHALKELLAVEPVRPPLLFDGLRGEEEVRAADRRFPGSRFLMLEAKAGTRVERLLRRRDPFDRGEIRTEVGTGMSSEGAAAELLVRMKEIEGIGDVLDPEELVRTWREQPDRSEELLRSLRIVVEEQRHYDQLGARRYLEELPRERRLIVDTDRLAADEVAAAVMEWL